MIFRGTSVPIAAQDSSRRCSRLSSPLMVTAWTSVGDSHDPGPVDELDRDDDHSHHRRHGRAQTVHRRSLTPTGLPELAPVLHHARCLLYTSDAADDLLCVDI